LVLYLSLGLVLFSFWILLSGHYTVITVTAAVLSTIVVVAMTARMKLLDREGHPTYLLWRVIGYHPWLGGQILRSAWDVSKVILNPKLPISPTMLKVRGSQKTAVGIATYANSITLTPGTLSARLNGNDILVHALTREGAEDLKNGEMDRRVTKFEGGE
jgi:multicomponent Na+:H+ antiporter subunit E